MIHKIVISLAVSTMISFVICNGKPLISNENEAKAFLQETSDKLFEFYDGIGKSFYEDKDNSYDQREELAKYTIFFPKIFEDVQGFDYKNFKDNELKFAFEALLNEVELKVIGERYLEIFYDIEDMTNLQYKKFFTDFNNNRTKLAYSPDVETVFESSDNPDELQYHWTKWRKILGTKGSRLLNVILKAFDEAAIKTEKTPLESWMKGFNLTDMENMMDTLQPLYMELHAFVRHQLRKKYGDSIILPDGLIPGHLYEQIAHQLSTDQSILNEIYPNQTIPTVEMDKYTGKYLAKTISKQFEKLGFEKYPSSFWRDRVQEIRLDDDDVCEASAWQWTPNVYLQYCDKMTFADLINFYSNLAYVYCAMEMVGLPGYYFHHPNSMGEAAAKAILLSATTIHNLKTLQLISDEITPEIEEEQLLSNAIESFFYLPMDFIHAKVIADLLSGNVTKAELNNHYWQLMEKYAGIGPPMGHRTSSYDMPLDFYEGIRDNDMSNRFTNHMLGFQMHKKMCELSGHYPKEPLHLCDINGNKEAGSALRIMMQLGASKPYHEVLAVMFPVNPTVNTDGILEYYKPIHKLIAEKNKEANVKPGWKTSN